MATSRLQLIALTMFCGILALISAEQVRVAADEESWTNPISGGAHAIFGEAKLKSDKPCAADALASIEEALKDIHLVDAKNIQRGSGSNGYDKWRQSLPALSKPTAQSLNGGGFPNDDSVSTITYTVKNGPDETVTVYAVDKYEARYGEPLPNSKTRSHTLRHLFVLVVGTSYCTVARCHKNGDRFRKYIAWASGNYEFERTTWAPFNAQGHQVPDPKTKVWGKKDLAVTSGWDELECCAVTEEPKTVPATPCPGGTSVETPTPKPTDPPIDKDRHFTPVQPKAGSGAGTGQGSYLPPIAGPRSQLVVTVTDPAHPGPTSYTVGTVEASGHRSFFSGVTDAVGRAHFRAALAVGVLKAIYLIRGFDDRGEPIVAAHCDIGNPAHLAGTELLSKPASGNLAIVEGQSGTQRGQEFILHIRGADPVNTRVLLDGRTDGVETLAVSNNSVVGRITTSVDLGLRKLSIESNGKRSNAVPVDIVVLMAEPIPDSEPGTMQTVRVHVDGLPAGAAASMYFDVGGAARRLLGDASTPVHVNNGVAELRIQGIRAGRALVLFHLKVIMPEYR